MFWSKAYKISLPIYHPQFLVPENKFLSGGHGIVNFTFDQKANRNGIRDGIKVENLYDPFLKLKHKFKPKLKTLHLILRLRLFLNFHSSMPIAQVIRNTFRRSYLNLFFAKMSILFPADR